METQECNIWQYFTTEEFLSYLWGMETISVAPHFQKSFFVLILPMRNGNIHFDTMLLFLLFLRSYPTYEEWKPSESVDTSILNISFLSYLWGMETLL